MSWMIREALGLRKWRSASSILAFPLKLGSFSMYSYVRSRIIFPHPTLHAAPSVPMRS
jgi:hypothetical protein